MRDRTDWNTFGWNGYDEWNEKLPKHPRQIGIRSRNQFYVNGIKNGISLAAMYFDDLGAAKHVLVLSRFDGAIYMQSGFLITNFQGITPQPQFVAKLEPKREQPSPNGQDVWWWPGWQRREGRYDWSETFYYFPTSQPYAEHSTIIESAGVPFIDGPASFEPGVQCLRGPGFVLPFNREQPGPPGLPWPIPVDQWWNNEFLNASSTAN